MPCPDASEATFLSASELAEMRSVIERAGFERDPLVGEHADRAHCGFNIAIAWPLPPEVEAAYRDFERRVVALDTGTYVYPLSTTHVTVMTAVNFKHHPDPPPDTTRAVAAAAAALGDFLVGSSTHVAAFTLDIGPPVLARTAAFLPMKNPTGEIARVRERSLAFCRATGGILAGASTPRSIHSTVLRFRDLPADPVSFVRGFDDIARTVRLGPITIDRLLITVETKPYMREGQVARSVALRPAK